MYIEAGWIDGAEPLRTFTQIVPPLCRPLVAVLFFMSVLSSWNDVAWPLIALRDNELYTRPIGLLYLQRHFWPDYGGTTASALIRVLPMVVLCLAFQRYFVQGSPSQRTPVVGRESEADLQRTPQSDLYRAVLGFVGAHRLPFKRGQTDRCTRRNGEVVASLPS